MAKAVLAAEQAALGMPFPFYVLRFQGSSPVGMNQNWWLKPRNPIQKSAYGLALKETRRESGNPRFGSE